MVLRANEYPDVWEFSDENPAPPPDYPSENRVTAFLNIFLTPQFFGRIVIWNRGFKYSRKYRIYGIDKGVSHRIIDWLPEAIELKPYLADSCEGGGHLSILFVPKSQQEFLKQIMKRGHYGKPKEISIGSGNDDDPFSHSDEQDVAFLESSLFHTGERIFTFSHDAQFLYEIFRE